MESAKDQKRFIRASLVILLAALVGMQLPHVNKSIAEFIIPPIKTGENSTLYLSGLLVLIPVIWGYTEIVKSNYLKMNSLLRFMLMFFIIIPLLFDKINLVKIPYYTFSSGLKSIEVVERNLVFQQESGKKDELVIDLVLKNYSKEVRHFNVSVDIPERLNEFISEPSASLPDRYIIRPKQRLHINEVIKFDYTEKDSEEGMFSSTHYIDDYKIHLFNEDDELAITINGSY